MKHLGDITKINGAEAPPVKVIISGSPCQDLSIAGRREGLKGERSGLFTEQIRIIKEMRAEDIKRGRKAVDIRPRYMVWENVPGAFSSSRGQDFKAVLEETIGIVKEDKPDIPVPKNGWHYSGAILENGFSVAWRVFDAQFWGVPQRRRRIALVADFGGTTAPEILFERESVPGDITQSGTPWKEFTQIVVQRFNSADKKRAGAEIRTDSKAPTLTAAAGMSGNNQPVLCIGNGQADNTRLNKVAGALNCMHDQQAVLCIRERCGCEGGGKGCLVQEDQSGALATNNDQFVCSLDRASFNQGVNAQYDPRISEDGVNSTLTTKGPGAVCESVVRRLTPLECERLQGFPDGWTDIGEYIDTTGKKRKTSDSARYKALGNSIALPPWAWVLERISKHCGDNKTMASLFDGIGGFPLIWETLNGDGTCLWASEIEEFPIAVTKFHFKENKNV